MASSCEIDVSHFLLSVFFFHVYNILSSLILDQSDFTVGRASRHKAKIIRNQIANQL